MSWWNIIKNSDMELHAVFFQYQLTQDNLAAYEVKNLNEKEKNFFKEILGKKPAFHYLLIAPINNNKITVNEMSEERINDLQESLSSMSGMINLSNQQKLDLVRMRPNTYCLVEVMGDYDESTRIEYVLGSKLIFDRAVDALENSKQQVKEMGS